MHVRRAGLRALHAAGYAFRSEEKKRESLVRTAFITPGMFERGVVRAHIFPIRPLGPRVWHCLLAVDFPLSLGEQPAGKAEREFAVVLRAGSSIFHRFDRKITVTYKNARAPTRQVSFCEPVDLQPGKYTVTTVLGASDSGKPYTTHSQVVVPPIPKGEVFLVDPVLGKRANQDLVVLGSGVSSEGRKSSEGIAKGDRIGTPRSFMPLLVQRVNTLDPIFALTQACLVKKRSRDTSEVARDLLFEDGTLAGTLPSVPLTLDPKGKVDCQSFLDSLPVASLRPTDYLFRARLDGTQEENPPSAMVRFAINRPARPGGGLKEGAEGEGDGRPSREGKESPARKSDESPAREGDESLDEPWIPR